MHIATLEVRLHLPDARSLKDKRQVVKSILDRARHRFQVAAAEVGENDVHRIAVLGFAAVSGSLAHAEEVIQKLLSALLAHPAARVIEHEVDSV